MLASEKKLALVVTGTTTVVSCSKLRQRYRYLQEMRMLVRGCSLWKAFVVAKEEFHPKRPTRLWLQGAVRLKTRRRQSIDEPSISRLPSSDDSLLGNADTSLQGLALQLETFDVSKLQVRKDHAVGACRLAW